MRAQRRQGRKATGQLRKKRGGHRTGNGAAHPPEQSGPDAVDTAALEYARALPALLRRALKRAARGKPSPLLRSAPRLIRECVALLDVQEDRRERKPKQHPQLGVLTDYELSLCTNLLEMHRGQRAALPHEPTTAPAPRERQEPAPEPAEPEARPLYSGPERRVRHIPSHVFLGHLERRRRPF